MNDADLDRMLTARGLPLTPENRLQERIDVAASIGMENGWIDGAHHKQWVITQMFRALLTDDELPVLGDDWEEGIAP